MNDISVFARIAKVDASKRLVYGYASTEALDIQGEIVRREALESALPEYMKFGNIREMHQPSAVGRAKEAEIDEKGLYLCAKVVDDTAWKKVQEGVYNGFSIGGKVTKRDLMESHVIKGLELYEISLVDRPANPEAVFECFKRDNREGDNVIMFTNDQVAARATILAKAAGKTEWGDFMDAARAELEKEANAAIGTQTAVSSVALATKAVTPNEGDELRKAARRAIKQVWTTSDGKTFEKADDATTHEAELTKRQPIDEVKAAVDDIKKTMETIDANRQGKVIDARSTANRTGEDGDRLSRTAATGSPVAGAVAELGSKVEEAESSNKSTDAPVSGSESELGARVTAAESTNKVTDEEHDTEKKGDKPYGDVEYADPGHQSDKKKRYPIDTAEHIRAAWNYINKPKNAGKYSPKDLASVKAKIVSAWKAKIDEKGPPSAREKSIVNASLVKGMSEVSRMACIIQELEWLHQAVEFEQEMERDTGSTQPNDIKEDIARLCATLRTMVDEETAELLNDEEMDMYGDLLEAAATPLHATHAAALLKAVESTRKASAVARRLVTVLGKVGRRHNSADMRKIQEMHDHSVSLGAMCDKSAGAGLSKVAGGDELSKLAAENGELRKQLGDVMPMLREVQDLVKKIHDTPAQVPPQRLQVVDKNDDSRIAKAIESLADQPPGNIAFNLIKSAIQNPRPLDGTTR